LNEINIAKFLLTTLNVRIMRKLLFLLLLCSMGLSARTQGSPPKTFLEKPTPLSKTNSLNDRQHFYRGIEENPLRTASYPLSGAAPRPSSLRSANAEQGILDSVIRYWNWNEKQTIRYREYYTYEYDDLNRIEKQICHRIDEDSNEEITYMDEYKYSSKGFFLGYKRFRIDPFTGEKIVGGFYSSNAIVDSIYGESGKLEKIIHESLTKEEHYYYDKEERLENRKYFSIDDEENRNLREETYYFYENDKEIALSTFYWSDNPVKDSTISFLENEQIISKETFNWDYDLQEWIKKSYTEYEHNQEGELISEITYNLDGKIISGYKYKIIVKNGQKTETQYIYDSNKDQFIPWYSETYDSEGVIIQEESYFNGNLYFTKEYASGKIIRFIYHNYDIISFEDNVYPINAYTDYVYDKNGNTILVCHSYSYYYYAEDYIFYYYSDQQPSVQPELPAYDLSNYPENSLVATHGKLQVAGSQLVNKDGKPVQLRGMSSHGIHWFENCYTEQSLKTLVEDWGIDVFRIASYVGDSGGYIFHSKAGKEKRKTQIDNLVDICEKLGIYCIIDWHTLGVADNDNTADPWFKINDAREFWDYMSRKHAHKAHVIYEICNEPNSTNSEHLVSWGRVRTYADEIIPVIRENDKYSIIIVGTPEFCTKVNIASYAPIPQTNIMYSLHFYAGSYQQDFRDIADIALKNKLPLFVTEFGTTDASGDGPIYEEETELWIKWMNERNISWVNWSFTDKGEGSAALTKGSCSKKEFNSITASAESIKLYFRGVGNPEIHINLAKNIIYPNPSAGIFYLNITDPVENLEILDITGKKVKEIHSPGSSFDISELIPGFYVVKIRIGKQFITQQIIKN
jgi:hypothetical protein